MLVFAIHMCKVLTINKSGSGITSLAWTYIKYVDTVTVFAKNWNKGHWPLDDLLTPHLLRSYVWLYPRIIVSKSHENTSKYVDTVTFLQKLEAKVIDP